MKTINEYLKETHSSMNEYSHVVHMTYGCVNDPCPPCHLDNDDWFWHNNPKVLIKYILEFIVGGQIYFELICSKVLPDEDECKYSFLELISLYINNNELSKEDLECVNKLAKMYQEILDKDGITYIDFVRYCIDIEEYGISVNLSSTIRTFYTPLDARCEPYLTYGEFNTKDLIENFDQYSYEDEENND